MYRSFNEGLPGAAASAVAYLDERRARRLGLGQLEARDRAAARHGEAVARYERNVLAWYALDRHAQARAAQATIVGHERALLAAQLPPAAPAPRRERARVRPLRRAQGGLVARLPLPVSSSSAV
jgi:hypothetical protein